jgi:hypothetical protein
MISDHTFQLIKKYIQFCLETRQDHESRLKELELIRQQVNE